MTPQAALFEGLQWALLHSLWEGALIALLLAVGLRQLPATAPEGRYRLGVGALVLFLIVVFTHWSYLSAQGTRADVRFVVESPAKETTQQVDATVASVQTSAVTPTTPVMQGEASLVDTDVPRRPDPWPVPWLISAWAIGVLIMLLRLLAGLRGVRALLHGSTPVPDSLLLAEFAALREAMAVRGQIALRASIDIATPLAVGILWPTVILPASLLTGLTPAQMRAVLAHELAHIRRYDYLVNFLQRIAEAFFYFNPALWWISRQIRFEREACCDALAARHSGDPLDYAAALVVATRHAAPAMALGNAMDGGDPGSVAERVQRLLRNGHRPALRCPWYSFASGLVAALLLGGGLYLGSHAAADAMVTYLRLNDTERVEYLREAMRLQHERETEHSVVVTGKVRMPDGSLCDERVQGSVIVRRDGGSSQYSYGTTVRKGTYKQESVPGETYFLALSPKHAPGYIGPVEIGLVERAEMPDLVLRPATSHTIRVEDDAGLPVADVVVGVSYHFPDLGGIGTFGIGAFGIGALEFSTDLAGEIAVPQTEPALRMSVSIESNGFEPIKSRTVDPTLGEVSVVRMKKDIPLRLRVTRGVGGPPATQAECYLLKSGRQNEWDAPQVAQILEGEGMIALTGLKRDRDKLLLVRDPDFGSARVQIPAWEAGPVEVPLQEYSWAGQITGDLDLLDVQDGAPGLSAFLYINVEDQWLTFARNHFIPVDVRDGVGYFRVNGMVPGQINLRVGGQEDTVKFESSRDDYRFMLVAGKDGKLSPKVPRRLLSINLATSSGSALPPGKIAVELLGEHSDNIQLSLKVPVAEGRGKVEVPVPARARISLDELPGFQVSQWQLADQSIAGNYPFVLPAGTGDLALQGILEVAGAIRCELVRKDKGQLNSGPIVVKELRDEVPKKENWYCFVDYTGIGWFTGLALGRTYTLVLDHEGNEIVRTVKLTEAEPVAQVRFEVESVQEPLSDRKVEVSVNSQDGSAISDFRVLLRSEDGTSSVRHGVVGGDSLTLTSARRGVAYHGWIAFDSAYAPVPVTLGPNDTEIRAMAKPGRRAQGRVLLRGSNAPVAGIVVATLMEDIGDLSETTTDEAGRFLFTNLPDVPVTVGLRSLGRRSWHPGYGEPMPLKDDGSTVLYLEEDKPQ